jgi:hypothetical protein
MKIVRFSLEQGNKYLGKVDGTRCFIDNRVPFDGGKGLMNVSGTSAQKYDRDHFTSSFLQYAAHVPNRDFVVYLRDLLNLPLAREYFPDLFLNNNRICSATDEGIVALVPNLRNSLPEGCSTGLSSQQETKNSQPRNPPCLLN